MLRVIARLPLAGGVIATSKTSALALVRVALRRGHEGAGRCGTLAVGRGAPGSVNWSGATLDRASTHGGTLLWSVAQQSPPPRCGAAAELVWWPGGPGRSGRRCGTNCRRAVTGVSMATCTSRCRLGGNHLVRARCVPKCWSSGRCCEAAWDTTRTPHEAWPMLDGGGAHLASADIQHSLFDLREA